jgi:ketosteroid isomerase-like protein
MEPKKIGETLMSLCCDGRYFDAITAYYSDDAVTVDMQGNGTRTEAHGIDEIRVRSLRWIEEHDVHSVSAEGPVLNGDQFSVIYELDLTPKRGPRAGERTKVREVGVYTTRHGRIVREEIFH